MLARLYDQLVVHIMLSLPSSRRQIASELGRTRAELKAKLAPTSYPNAANLVPTRVLPEKGRDRAWLEDQWKGLKALEKGDVDNGRVSGTVYHVSRSTSALPTCRKGSKSADRDREEKISMLSSTKPCRNLSYLTHFIRMSSPA